MTVALDSTLECPLTLRFSVNDEEVWTDEMDSLNPSLDPPFIPICKLRCACTVEMVDGVGDPVDRRLMSGRSFFPPEVVDLS